jgi:hypothetical protein
LLVVVVEALTITLAVVVEQEAIARQYLANLLVAEVPQNHQFY